MAIVLKQEVKDMILTSGKLFGDLADFLKVKPTSLGQAFTRNYGTLTDYETLKFLSEHLGKTPDELIEDEAKVLTHS